MTYVYYRPKVNVWCPWHLAEEDKGWVSTYKTLCGKWIMDYSRSEVHPYHGKTCEKCLAAQVTKRLMK